MVILLSSIEINTLKGNIIKDYIVKLIKKGAMKRSEYRLSKTEVSSYNKNKLSRIEGKILMPLTGRSNAEKCHRQLRKLKYIKVDRCRGDKEVRGGKNNNDNK